MGLHSSQRNNASEEVLRRTTDTLITTKSRLISESLWETRDRLDVAEMESWKTTQAFKPPALYRSHHRENRRENRRENHRGLPSAGRTATLIRLDRWGLFGPPGDDSKSDEKQLLSWVEIQISRGPMPTAYLLLGPVLGPGGLGPGAEATSWARDPYRDGLLQLLTVICKVGDFAAIKIFSVENDGIRSLREDGIGTMRKVWSPSPGTLETPGPLQTPYSDMLAVEPEEWLAGCGKEIGESLGYLDLKKQRIESELNCSCGKPRSGGLFGRLGLLRFPIFGRGRRERSSRDQAKGGPRLAGRGKKEDIE